jgi:hypothetical protein
MVSTGHLRWILAAAVFFSLWAMPSVSLAHDGHAHRAPAAIETSAPATPDISETRFDASKDRQVEISFTGSELTSNSGSPTSGCVDGCCSMAGMACCGGAIIPSVIEASPIQLSTLFAFDPMLVVHGLPPEALPKPPKAFA